MPHASRFPPLLPLSALLLGALACRGGTCAREVAERVASSDAGVPAASTVQTWWAPAGYSLVEADVNGDGLLDLVGLCSNREVEGPLFVGAFDGKTFELRWRSASARVARGSFRGGPG